MPKFLIRSKPYKEEALQQYLLRIAKVNGYSIAELNSFIIQHTGFSYRNNTVEARGLLQQFLFKMTGHKEIMELFDHRRWLIKFMSIFDYTRLKVCLRCLNEYGHCFSQWYYLHNLICMSHRVFLVDRCDRCNEMFTDASLVFGACINCNRKLEVMETLDCFSSYSYGNHCLIKNDQQDEILNGILSCTNNLRPYYEMFSVNSFHLWRLKKNETIPKLAELIMNVNELRSNSKMIVDGIFKVMHNSQEQYNLTKSLGKLHIYIDHSRYPHFTNVFKEAFLDICKQFPDLFFSLLYFSRVFNFNVEDTRYIHSHSRAILVSYVNQREVVYLRNVELFFHELNSISTFGQPRFI